MASDTPSPDSDATGTVTASDVTGLSVDERAELEDLRLRVAAQERMIEAIIEENDDIHSLRRRNLDLEAQVGRLLGNRPAQLALKLRRRILRRPDPV
jgi:hypothetical protein